MKVHPVIVSSTEFRLGEHVVIYDLDDDMHGKEGIFHGRCKHEVYQDMRYLILLIDNQKYIQVAEHQLQKIKTMIYNIKHTITKSPYLGQKIQE